MKNLIFILIIFTIISYSLKAQIPSCYVLMNDVTTPKGKPVETYNIPCELSLNDRQNLDDEFSIKKGILEVLTTITNPSATQTYNCHGYAWIKSEKNGQIRYLDATNTPAPNPHDAHAYMTDGSYIQVTREIFPGKVYYSSNHSAVTTEVPGEYICKWSTYEPLVRYVGSSYNNNASVRSYYVKPDDMPIDGPSTFSSQTTFTVPIASSGYTYNWTVPSGFNGYSTSSTINITPTPGASGQLRVDVHKGTDHFVITKNIYYIPSIIGPASFCPSTSVTFTASNAPAGYQWGKSSNLTTLSTSGNTITVSAASPGTGWVSINSNNQELFRLNVTINALPASRTINGNGYFFFYSGIGSDVYTLASLNQGESVSWSITPTSGVSLSQGYPSPGQVTVYSFGVADTYTLKATITNSDLCSTVVTKNIQIRDGGKSSASPIAYPIPADQTLYVDLDQILSGLSPAGKNPVFDVRLYDIQGNMMRQTTAKGGIVQFDVSNLSNGIYFVHIYDGINKNPQIVKIIVEH